ncbi:MAG: DUF4142 domain-containing protein [Opitutaceae bacterium]|nr:DUF4142 domain-containing protein [Cytophagales bacterium]
MKTNYLILGLTSLVLTFSGCDKNDPDAKKAEEVVNNAANDVGDAVEKTVDKVKIKIDESFAKNVLDNNTEELEWLRAGTKMGTDPELKAIAQQMIPDHEKLAKDIKTYAAQKDFQLDQDNGGVQIDSKTGITWDQNWAEKIKKMHRDMVDKFERTQSNTEDKELKELVTSSLPMLRDHLNKAEKLEARLNK